MTGNNTRGKTTPSSTGGSFAPHAGRTSRATPGPAVGGFTEAQMGEHGYVRVDRATSRGFGGYPDNAVCYVDDTLTTSNNEAFGDTDTGRNQSFRTAVWLPDDQQWEVNDITYGIVLMDNVDTDDKAALADPDNYTTGDVVCTTRCSDPTDPGGTEINCDYTYDQDRLALLPTRTIEGDYTFANWMDEATEWSTGFARGRHQLFRNG